MNENENVLEKDVGMKGKIHFEDIIGWFFDVSIPSIIGIRLSVKLFAI